MKRIVLIALAMFGAGIATSKADVGFSISFGGNGYCRPAAPVYVRPYSPHRAYHQDVAEAHADVHHDLKHEHKDFHRAAKYQPWLRSQHGAFHRELKQSHGSFHHEVSHDHERFHGYGH